jgi:hypothetical protein
LQTGVTFADAAREWLRYVEHDRQRKPSTLAGYRALVRSQLLPALGEMRVEHARGKQGLRSLPLRAPDGSGSPCSAWPGCETTVWRFASAPRKPNAKPRR